MDLGVDGSARRWTDGGQVGGAGGGTGGKPDYRNTDKPKTRKGANYPPHPAYTEEANSLVAFAGHMKKSLAKPTLSRQINNAAPQHKILFCQTLPRGDHDPFHPATGPTDPNTL